MSALVWNCWGIGNASIVRVLKVLIRENQPDLVFLSKTKIDEEKMVVVKKKGQVLREEKTQQQKEKAGGIMMMWKEGLSIEMEDDCKWWIKVRLLEDLCVTLCEI